MREPRIKFEGFEEAWEQYKLGDVVQITMGQSPDGSTYSNIPNRYNADIIVFEHLNRTGKKRDSKNQRFHLWRSQEVQSMVTDRVHWIGIRISHICAWGTSRLAYDGSGRVLRGKEAGLSTYSLCQFQNGRVYNCDLSASCNIGSRYFIREILKSLPVKVRLELEAKVPQVSKKSTCTWSKLINLNAELIPLAA